MKDNVAIVIPAYNPGENLKEIVNNLEKNQYKKIIIIDDGSVSKNIFRNLRNQAIIIGHNKNKGKGRALKTGFNYCIKNLSNLMGIITIDADGQHEIYDINKIYREFQNKKNSVLLGSRQFEKLNIPLRSRIGNKMMSTLLEKKMKTRIKDTQTGLRAIPMKYIKELENIKGEGFEYETNMLIYCIKNNINIKEIPINTIYINRNKQSNFRIFKDSIKIYKTIKNCSYRIMS